MVQLTLKLTKMSKQRDNAPIKIRKIDGKKLLINCWNCRSLNGIGKIKECMKAKPQILMLQEIWDPTEKLLETLGGTQVVNKRNDKYGGTLTMWEDGLLSPVGKSIQVNQDSTLTKAVLAGNRILWIGSIYIHKGTTKDILNTFSEIKKYVPQSEWRRLLLAGDWNVDIESQEDKYANTLKIILKQMQLHVHSVGPTRKGRTLDFIVAGMDIKVSNLNKVATLWSDHAILSAEIEIPISKTSSKIIIPNKKAAIKLTKNAIKGVKNSTKFFTKVKSLMEKRNNNIMKSVKKPKIKNELLELILEVQQEDEDLEKLVQGYWNQLHDKNEEKKYSCIPQDVKEAFEFLKRSTKYNDIIKEMEL